MLTAAYRFTYYSWLVASTSYPLPIKEQVKGLRFGFQTGYSLYIFAPLSPIRVACCRIAFHPTTNYIVMILIFFSCFTVAMDRPSLSIQDKILLQSVSSFVNFLFFLEACLKIIGLNFQVGLYRDQKALYGYDDVEQRI